MAVELQNVPSRRRLVDEFQQLQEEGKRQEMSQRGQKGGRSQSKSKTSLGRIKKREKKQKEKEVVDLVSDEEDETNQYAFGHQGMHLLLFNYQI
jgi:hypothetical protein